MEPVSKGELCLKSVAQENQVGPNNERGRESPQMTEEVPARCLSSRSRLFYDLEYCVAQLN